MNPAIDQIRQALANPTNSEEIRDGTLVAILSENQFLFGVVFGFSNQFNQKNYYVRDENNNTKTFQESELLVVEITKEISQFSNLNDQLMMQNLRLNA